MIDDSGGVLRDFLAPLAFLVPVLLLIAAIMLMRRKSGQAPTEKNPPQTQVLRAIPTDNTPFDAEPASALTEIEPAHAPEPDIDWDSRIAQAEASADNTGLAEAHLGKARADIAQQNSEQAAEHLRTSLRAAIKAKSIPVQAEARLELAEIARASGDLTTACEHWQIARGLYHKLSNAARLDETERQMRTHGCPTDWVLTDF